MGALAPTRLNAVSNGYVCTNLHRGTGSNVRLHTSKHTVWQSWRVLNNLPSYGSTRTVAIPLAGVTSFHEPLFLHLINTRVAEDSHTWNTPSQIELRIHDDIMLFNYNRITFLRERHSIRLSPIQKVFCKEAKLVATDLYRPLHFRGPDLCNLPSCSRNSSYVT